MFDNHLEHQNAISKAADVIANRFPRPPIMGIVLGTGAGDIADAIEIESVVAYEEVPGLPRSTALGHQGRWVGGQLAGQPVLAMQGRFHLYEGYPLELATLPIHVMAELGVQALFVTNAAGGLNPNFRSGDLMRIDSHVDFMWRSHPSLFRHQRPETSLAGRPWQHCDHYDKDFAQLAHRIARQQGFPLHQGVYAALLGPNYETRSEYRMLRKLGIDAAGMSTVPEITVGRYLGMRTMAISVITNLAKPDVLESTSGEEVINAAEVAAPRLLQLIRAILQAE